MIYGLVTPRFENLPAEAIDAVLSFLGVKDLGRVERASKLVYTQITQAPHMQNYVWRNVYHDLQSYLGAENSEFGRYVRSQVASGEVRAVRDDAKRELVSRGEGSFCSREQDVPPREWKEICARSARTLAAQRQERQAQREQIERIRARLLAAEREEAQRGRGGWPHQPRVPPGIWYDPVNPFDPRGIV